MTVAGGPVHGEPGILDEQAAWLLLTVGDRRQHGGNDGYADELGVGYRWDSTVPHHADIKPGDAVIFWDKNSSLGASIIEEIKVGTATKLLKKCPSCGKAGIKRRAAMQPAYKCYKCGTTFDEPTIQWKLVTTYLSRHDVGWVDLPGVVAGKDLRLMCEDPGSQQSMRPFKWGAFVRALKVDGVAHSLDAINSSAKRIGGGHNLRTVRVRIGQPRFRKALVNKHGETCAFVGATPLEALEAGHLYSYAREAVHHTDGGLLLRRDIHRLFDLGFLAVNPSTWTIWVSPALASFAGYAELAGQSLNVDLSSGQRDWLKSHWKDHVVLEPIAHP
ncbi:HNH endonuclease signature motif containing protein [Cryobacterium sp. M15]|uniref:HNH endonuclease signature motif containing protein n=1 Tax=Cryobacterium sp. M15 TaxID=2048291 RepID=UPI000CE41F90|nr:HNH endonuclease signature motif containing protein [Cryobacterium sp. M15]